MRVPKTRGFSTEAGYRTDSSPSKRAVKTDSSFSLKMSNGGVVNDSLEETGVGGAGTLIVVVVRTGALQRLLLVVGPTEIALA